MTPAQQAEFLERADVTMAYLEALYSDVRTALVGRLAVSAVWVPQSLLDWYTKVPASARTSLAVAEKAMEQLRVMVTQVPHGGPPHGTPEKWLAVWLELAESTEANLRAAAGGLGRTGAFQVLLDSWGDFSTRVVTAVEKLPQAAMGVGTLLLGAAALYWALMQGSRR